MPRPGPRRRPVPLRLSADEERPARELAATLPPGPGGPNLSEAIRLLMADGVLVRQGRAVTISPDGADALNQLAEEAGIQREEVVRLALSYAVQHAARWLP